MSESQRRPLQLLPQGSQLHVPERATMNLHNGWRFVKTSGCQELYLISDVYVENTYTYIYIYIHIYKRTHHDRDKDPPAPCTATGLSDRLTGHADGLWAAAAVLTSSVERVTQGPLCQNYQSQ